RKRPSRSASLARKPSASTASISAFSRAVVTVCRSTCLPFCNICALGFDLAGTGTIFPVGPQAACGELSTLQRDTMLPSSSAAQPRGVDRRQPTPSGGAMQERPPEKEPAMGKTVLIVEDNELNMKLFQDLLEAHGY